MFKKYSKFCALILFGIFNIFVTTASAIDLDEATRTIVVDSAGNTTVLSPEQVKLNILCSLGFNFINSVFKLCLKNILNFAY